MADGPDPDAVRRALREREGRDAPEPTDAGPERGEDRAREMRDRVEPPDEDE